MKKSYAEVPITAGNQYPALGCLRSFIGRVEAFWALPMEPGHESARDGVADILLPRGVSLAPSGQISKKPRALSGQFDVLHRHGGIRLDRDYVVAAPHTDRSRSQLGLAEEVDAFRTLTADHVPHRRERPVPACEQREFLGTEQVRIAVGPIRDMHDTVCRQELEHLPRPGKRCVDCDREVMPFEAYAYPLQ